MAKVSMKLEGFEQLQRALVSAPDVVRAHASDAINASSFAIAQRARTLVPVDEGNLKRAIETSRPSKSRSGDLTGGVGLNTNAVFYWRFLEFGTVKMSARPFFRPSAESEQNAFIQRMRDIGPKLERDLSVSRLV